MFKRETVKRLKSNGISVTKDLTKLLVCVRTQTALFLLYKWQLCCIFNFRPPSSKCNIRKPSVQSSGTPYSPRQSVEGVI